MHFLLGNNICVCLNMHVNVCICVYENRWENEVLNIKWQVIWTVVFKDLNYLSNFKPIYFENNFLNIAQTKFFTKTKVVAFSMWNNFHVQIFLSFHTKVEENLNSNSNRLIMYFCRDFKFKLLNWAPNENKPETKVVGFEIWNSFHIQNFSSVNCKFWEKFKFESDKSLSLSTLFFLSPSHVLRRPSRGRRPHAALPGQTASPPPGSPKPPQSARPRHAAPPPAHTPRMAAEAPRRRRAEPADCASPLLSPLTA